jgi:hypothetical protein
MAHIRGLKVIHGADEHYRGSIEANGIQFITSRNEYPRYMCNAWWVDWDRLRNEISGPCRQDCRQLAKLLTRPLMALERVIKK